MKVYVYQAALYCQHCGADHREGVALPEGADLNDESTFDSDAYPKGPYSNGGGEADTPQHCDDCHEFLENPLTSDGDSYVREAVEAFGPCLPDESWSEVATRLEGLGSTPQGNGPVVAQWVRYYLAPGMA